MSRWGDLVGGREILRRSNVVLSLRFAAWKGWLEKLTNIYTTPNGWTFFMVMNFMVESVKKNHRYTKHKLGKRMNSTALRISFWIFSRWSIQQKPDWRFRICWVVANNVILRVFLKIFWGGWYWTGTFCRVVSFHPQLHTSFIPRYPIVRLKIKGTGNDV